MMKKILFTTFFFLLILTNTSAQKENSNWYFGENAGLNFNTSPTSIFTDGKITTLNKAASISDASGNLLFYTNGKTVWNKNHTIMQNGNQTIRSSNSSEYQSVVILPIPNSNKYYIFTEDAGFSNPEGFLATYLFSVVDMNSNGGLGKVETLNKVLLSSIHTVNGQQNYNFYFHNMTSALHSDGETYWLILNPNDRFYAFHITSSVLLENPNFVSSTTNCQNVLAKSNCTQYSSKLSLKASPTSNKLASIQNSNPCLAGSKIDIYDFDNSTGIISSCSSSITDTPEYASLEFSPNGNYLYVLKDLGEDKSVVVYDVSNPLQSISNLTITSNTQNNYLPRGNSIQRGIDGNLYFLDDYANQSISVIQNSNTPSIAQVLNNNLTFTNPVGQFPKLIPYNECRLDVTITATISSGEDFNKSAQNTITATNSINSGATANYDAGNTVYLKPGFHAKSGANFRAFIEGCSTNTSYSRNSNTSVSYSKQTTAIVDRKNIEVYPNPTVNSLYVKSKGAIRKWSLSNFYGKNFYSGNGNVQVIQTQNLPKGIYLLKIVLNNGDRITEKIIKE
jgi:hypothetical protein